MHHRATDFERCHPTHARPGVWHHPPPPLEITMMNRIRTRFESKRAANQLQSLYGWRPRPPRG